MQRQKIFFFLFSFISSSVFSQTASVSGKLIDAETDDAIRFATVTLNNLTDSSFATGAISDESGNFNLQNIGAGNYYLLVTSVGYHKHFLKIELSTGESYSAGTISMAKSEEAIGQIEVSGKKSTANTDLEKLTYNVEVNPANEGADILDILKKVPGITVDQDGNIWLRGSDNVLVLVDEKQSALQGATRTASLKQIPANAIEKIEVITSPSAKYDPDGMAGIINIVFKKEERQGVHGEVSFTYGTVKKYLPTIDLSYRHRRFNIFAGFDGIWKEFLKHNEALDRYDFADSLVLHRKYYGMETMKSKIYRGGLDLFLTKKSTLSFYALYEDEFESDDGYVLYKWSRFEHFDSGINREFLELEYNDVYDLSLLFKHDFDSTGKKSLQCGFIYSSAREQEVYDFAESIIDSSENVISPDVMKEKTDLDETNASGTLYLDYSQPLAKGKLEAGYKSIIRTINLDFTTWDTDFYPPVIIPGRNFLFNYKEQIHAAYGVLNFSKNKFSFEFGARLELALTKSTEDSTDFAYENNYFRVYPSVKISKAFNKEHKLFWAYSGRVNRPEFDQLNPIPKYVDPLNLKRGNPALNPEYAHSLELGWKKFFRRANLSVSLFYKYVHQPIYEIAVSDSGHVVNFIPQNFDRAQNFGAEMLSTFTLTKWWEMTGSFTIYDNIIDAMPEYDTEKQMNFSWNTKLTSFMYLPKNIEFTIDGYYIAPDVIPQGKVLHRYAVDAAVSIKLLKQKLKIFAKATDIFNTLTYGKEIDSQTYHLESLDDPESRVGYFGASYKF